MLTLMQFVDGWKAGWVGLHSRSAWWWRFLGVPWRKRSQRSVVVRRPDSTSPFKDFEAGSHVLLASVLAAASHLPARMHAPAWNTT